MDRNLRTLERLAYSSGDLVVLQTYFHRLKALGPSATDQILKLYGYVEESVPEAVREWDYEFNAETEDPDLIKLINFVREVGRYIWQKLRIDPTFVDPHGGPTAEEIDSHAWMVVEFGETRFMSDPTKVIALTGVYLVNTQNTYIASLTPSFFRSALYPNIYDILHHSNHESLESDWYFSTEDDYIQRRMLRGAINYYPIPNEVVLQCEQESEGDSAEMLNCLREAYLSNHVL